jgi:hypothetical protein
MGSGWSNHPAAPVRLPPPNLALLVAPTHGRRAADEALALDEDDFDEVYEPYAPAGSDGAYAARAEHRRETTVTRDPASARYVVTAGARPGEITLRPLEPGEPAPYGAPVATLSPSSAFDAWSIGALLEP